MKHVLLVTSAVLICVAAGCADTPATSLATHAAHAGGNDQVDASKYLLAEEPDGAVGVIAVRAIESKDPQDVVMVGRIGGANPFVDGRAAFMMLDASLILCEEGDSCPCCQDEIRGANALVKVVDENSRLLAADAREAFGLKANDMVVVRGKAKRDEAGNVTVLADGVYVRR